MGNGEKDVEFLIEMSETTAKEFFAERLNMFSGN